MEFLGYERPDGSAGVRNHVVVIPAGRCSNDLAAVISDQVPKTTALLHNHGCLLLKPDNDSALRTLIGLGRNPNVAAVLVVGVGCESVSAVDIAAGISASGKPVDMVTVEKSGGFQAAVEKGVLSLRHMNELASQMVRTPCDIGKLTIGVKCGGSATLSGLAGNAAIGWALDKLIANNGSAIFTETTEIIGAEHVLVRRAASPEVGQRLLEFANRAETLIKNCGVDIRGTQPTPANIANGLTTIEEKSLGAIVKSGTTPLQSVLEYAERPQGKGLHFMDCSAWTSHLFVGLAAAGAQISVFSLGGGLAGRFRTVPGAVWVPTIPTLKVVSDPELKTEKEYIDVFAGTIVDGDETKEQVGERLFEEFIKIASGKMSKLEMHPGFRDILELYFTGPWI
jgi:altronate dehydratase large subunit